MSGIVSGTTIKPSRLAAQIMEMAGFLCDWEVAYSASTHPALVIAGMPWRPEAAPTVAAFLRAHFIGLGGYAGQRALTDAGITALTLIELRLNDQLQALIVSYSIDVAIDEGDKGDEGAS